MYAFPIHAYKWATYIFLGKKKGSTDPCQLEMCFKEIGKAKKPEPKMVIAGKITNPSYLWKVAIVTGLQFNTAFTS